MKRSVLSACAAIVQKEIEFYAGFTCLEYDVNDENGGDRHFQVHYLCQ